MARARARACVHACVIGTGASASVIRRRIAPMHAGPRYIRRRDRALDHVFNPSADSCVLDLHSFACVQRLYNIKVLIFGDIQII